MPQWVLGFSLRERTWRARMSRSRVTVHRRGSALPAAAITAASSDDESGTRATWRLAGHRPAPVWRPRSRASAVLACLVMHKPLTESVLRRLTSEALVAYLGHAEAFEAAIHAGVSLGTSGEAVADLNYVVAGRGANDGGHFGAMCTTCISRN